MDGPELEFGVGQLGPGPELGLELEFDITPPQKGQSETSPKKVNFAENLGQNTPEPRILDPGHTLPSVDSPRKVHPTMIPPKSSLQAQPMGSPSFGDDSNRHEFAIKTPSPPLPTSNLPRLLEIVENLNQKYFDVHESYDEYFTVDKCFEESRIRAFLADSIFAQNSLIFSDFLITELVKQLKIKGHSSDSPATNLFETFFSA